MTVNVVPRTCPCSIWDDSLHRSPTKTTRSAVEVGVKFRSDESGFITGLRFYKTSGNTGTHVGHLWTADGTQLAEATFTRRDRLRLAAGRASTRPVAIDANTTYVASYHAPNGHYAASNGYFATGGFDSAPLHALGDGVDGPNGVYKYGPSGGLFSGGGPTPSSRATTGSTSSSDTDVGPDTTPPTISARSPGSGASGVATGAQRHGDLQRADGRRARSTAPPFELRDPSNALVAGDRQLQRGTEAGDARPEQPAPELDRLHGDDQGRRRRGHDDAAGQRARRRLDLVRSRPRRRRRRRPTRAPAARSW